MDFNWQSYKKAIENEFTIVNKDKIEVPFVVNSAQDDCGSKLTERNVILKARKMGFSSLLLAIAAIKFIFGENERCVSMSFDASASSKQLERAKHYIQSFGIKNGAPIKTKYNSKSEMVYEGISRKTGRPYQNTLRIGTAKSNSFGRGDDITFLHLTEVSSADHLENLLAGVGEAMVNNSMVTLETTANGFNEFKTFWDEAEKGERGYQTLFYSPKWEYSDEYLEEKKKNLGRLFAQEYPMTAEEAFLTSGQCFFDMDSLRLALNTTTEPLTSGVIYE